ncbi:hypothetical protein [Streptomyces coffeae]|uniref:Uncharacterized protein n=1 Tax=Streptomyces coffeae TaxID=621382 RepID=A0ABS1ND91_9ACTN|nr:hypothetical protein [Streptomyces coffeae]MBL1098052.1 hypothetical protein [Streptomyces coffeae]
MQHVRAKKPNRRLRPWIVGSAVGVALIVGGGMAAQAATSDHSRPAKPAPSATAKPETTKPPTAKPEPTKPPTSVPEPTKPAPIPPSTSAPKPTKPAPVPPTTSAPEPPKPAPTKASR